MAKDLIIVESPTKAKTIGKFLKGKYNIKASMGHIRDLPKKTIGVDIEKNFQPKYVSDTRQKKVIKELKIAVKEAENIYLASDHDREGEAIAWHLVESLRKEIKDKNVYRIIFNQITKDAIRKAISNPAKIDQNKVDSQQARRILDRLVGYNVSPFLWKVITKSLSAGRVQSVALRIICEREDEIQKFEPKEYWKIEANLNKDELTSFKAILTKIDGKKAELSNKEEADNIFANIEK
ncbi:MAG: type I DNA topoisomerase, partial [Candidatus Cloacimonetes bacterium]|nr:type I DNA topoisomerase [Candidatus Cloacimonadota bacterium]